jgi:hypothetical protein
MSCNHTPQPPKPHHPNRVQHQAIAIVLPVSLLVAFLVQLLVFLVFRSHNPVTSSIVLIQPDAIAFFNLVHSMESASSSLSSEA